MRRPQGLFGRTFQLEVRREIGDGTPVTMSIPLTEQSSSRLRLDIPAFTLPLVYRGLTRLTHRTVLFWHAEHEQAQSQVAQVREALPCGRPL